MNSDQFKCHPHPTLLPSKGEGAKKDQGKRYKIIMMKKNVMAVSFILKIYLAVYPPSTGNTAPVINEASSDAKKRIAWAISSG